MCSLGQLMVIQEMVAKKIKAMKDDKPPGALMLLHLSSKTTVETETLRGVDKLRTEPFKNAINKRE